MPLVMQTVNALRAKDTLCRYVFTDIYALRAKKVIAQRALTSVKKQQSGLNFVRRT
jgi:hypothetical protein